MHDSPSNPSRGQAAGACCGGGGHAHRHGHHHGAHSHGHTHPEALGAISDPNPVLVEATRGETVESQHRGRLCVVDTEGNVVLQGGDIMSRVFPRSAIKMLQALPLVESGAAEAFQLTDAELALACASHEGEPRHTEAVERWLTRIGLGIEDLECGHQWPYSAEAGRALAAKGAEPGALHNNCSGKHAGFLTLAKQLGAPTRGYIAFTHAVQQRVLGALEVMTGLDDLSQEPRGIDGCSIPTIALPLGNLALAMARFADPADQPEKRQEACRRLRRAMAAEPFMVAGSGRACTRIMEVTGERALVKIGAEGIYCAALPGLGLGVALKIDDGNARAAEVAIATLLKRLGVLSAEDQERLATLLETPILNRAGKTVGVIRPTAALAA